MEILTGCVDIPGMKGYNRIKNRFYYQSSIIKTDNKRLWIIGTGGIFMKPAKLRLEDIRIGDIVSEASLSDIFNVYITLVDSKIVGEDIVGRVAYIGKDLNAEADRVVAENDNICAVYNDIDEVEGEVTYDE